MDLNNMTLTEIAQNNSGLLQSFAIWLKTLQVSAVNRAPGMSVIPPGYRAIVNWVKDRMVQDIYKRLR